jgi:hypothetical protein
MTAPFTTYATPTWSIGGITLNAVDANGVRWIVGFAGDAQTNPTSGWWDLPTQRNFDTPLPRNSGQYRSTSYKAGRPITINGWVDAPNKQLREAARDQLMGLQFGTGLLTLTVADDYSTRWAACELVDLKTSAPNVTAFDFQLQLNAPDPRKYSATAVSGNTTVPSSVGGLDYTGGGSTGLDYTGANGGMGTGGLYYGTAGSTGTFTLANSGSTGTWPVFTLSGLLTNPTITNIATGQQLSYQGTIAAGQTLVITTNPLSRTVLLNGGDVRANLAVAQYANVPPQSQSTYALNAAPADTGVASGQIYPAWW